MKRNPNIPVVQFQAIWYWHPCVACGLDFTKTLGWEAELCNGDRVFICGDCADSQGKAWEIFQAKEIHIPPLERDPHDYWQKPKPPIPKPEPPPNWTITDCKIRSLKPKKEIKGSWWRGCKNE